MEGRGCHVRDQTRPHKQTGMKHGAREQNKGRSSTYRHINTNLTRLDFLVELARARTALREDGNTVTVFVSVDQLNRVVKCGDVEADEDGSEDLLFVAGHVFRHVGDERWADLLSWSDVSASTPRQSSMPRSSPSRAQLDMESVDLRSCHSGTSQASGPCRQAGSVLPPSPQSQSNAQCARAPAR